MFLINEIVVHKNFGNGKIVAFNNNSITVVFDNGKTEKKFLYPSSFGTFLEIDNKILIDKIESDKKQIVLRELEAKNELEEQLKISTKQSNNSFKYKKIPTPKTNEKNNIAFKCNYCDGGQSKSNIGFKDVCSDKTIAYNILVAKHVWCSSLDSQCSQYCFGKISRGKLEEICQDDGFVCYESQMLRLWKAKAGITKNGNEKEKPMTIRNVKANSLCILSTRLPYSKDEERFIFAVFLINDNYEGDNNEEGYVEADEKYKISLSLEEAKKIKFWDYYFNQNNPSKMVFGSGLHRYFTDIQSAQVLQKITEIKKGTPEEMFVQEFLEHYCKIKKLDINNLPKPNGALYLQ